MIVYFANRKMDIVGTASTSLDSDYIITADKKSESIDDGVTELSLTVAYTDDGDRLAIATVGNYILRKSGDTYEVYTIIESEKDTESRTIDLYAEDAGLDLLNEIAPKYTADKAYTAAQYIERFTEDSGFEIGINEIPQLKRTLSWDGESTVTERIRSVATQFDNAEIGYSFDIDGLSVTRKLINIYKMRGKDVSQSLRLNNEISRITEKKSIANLATALKVTGGTPETTGDTGDTEPQPITLKGYSYNDGNISINSDGDLVSRDAFYKWSRYLSERGTGNGHIYRSYSFDTLSQKELCSHAITELKKRCEPEINYDVEIVTLPDGLAIGDRINIVDEQGKLYISARVLKLDTSETTGNNTATLGEYLIKNSGVSERVLNLSKDFKTVAQSQGFIKSEVRTAQQTAEEAHSTATSASSKADEAKSTAEQASSTATQASETASQASTTANNANAKADEATATANSASTKADEAKAEAQNAVTVATSAHEALVTATDITATNVNISGDATIKNQPLAAWIIDTGSKMVGPVKWDYQKWSDGVVDCWCRTGGNYTPYVSNWPGLAYGRKVTLNLPFTFDGNAVVTGNGRVGSGINYTFFAWDTTSQITLCTAASLPGAQYCTFNIRIKGKIIE